MATSIGGRGWVLRKDDFAPGAVHLGKNRGPAYSFKAPADADMLCR